MIGASLAKWKGPAAFGAVNRRDAEQSLDPETAQTRIGVKHGDIDHQARTICR